MDDARTEYRRYLSDHPGHPLGRGMPMGSPLRREVFNQRTGHWRGESHLMAWERICRGDPCAFCGAPVSGTVDHIEPRSYPVRGLGGAHSWLNLTGACERCNGAKGSKDLLFFLAVRRASSPRVAKPPRKRYSPPHPNATRGERHEADEDEIAGRRGRVPAGAGAAGGRGG